MDRNEGRPDMLDVSIYLFIKKTANAVWALYLFWVDLYKVSDKIHLWLLMFRPGICFRRIILFIQIKWKGIWPWVDTDSGLFSCSYMSFLDLLVSLDDVLIYSYLFLFITQIHYVSVAPTGIFQKGIKVQKGTN